MIWKFKYRESMNTFGLWWRRRTCRAWSSWASDGTKSSICVGGWILLVLPLATFIILQLLPLCLYSFFRICTWFGWMLLINCLEDKGNSCNPNSVDDRENLFVIKMRAILSISYLVLIATDSGNQCSYVGMIQYVLRLVIWIRWICRWPKCQF